MSAACRKSVDGPDDKRSHLMSDRYLWLVYVALAGLAWGTYVSIIFYGGNERSARPGGSGRFMAILCVGAAYFVIGVLLPLLMFSTGWLGVKWEIGRAHV